MSVPVFGAALEASVKVWISLAGKNWSMEGTVVLARGPMVCQASFVRTGEMIDAVIDGLPPLTSTLVAAYSAAVGWPLTVGPVTEAEPIIVTVPPEYTATPGATPATPILCLAICVRMRAFCVPCLLYTSPSPRDGLLSR